MVVVVTDVVVVVAGVVVGGGGGGVPVFFPRSGPVWGALVGLATWSLGPWSPGALCLCFASSY